MVGQKAHWATKVRLDFTSEFDEKGIPFEKEGENESEEMQQLESFFKINGEKAALPLKLLADTLNGVRQGKDPNMKLQAKFGYRWRASAIMKTVSDTDPSVDAVGRTTGEAAAGSAAVLGAGPAATSSSSAPPAAAGQSPLSARAAKARASSPRLSSSRRESPDLTHRGSAESRQMDRLSAQLYNLWEHMDADDELVQKEIFQQVHRAVTPSELQAARPPAPLGASDLPPIFQRPASRQQRDQPRESHYEYFRRRQPDQNANRRDYKQRQVNSARRTLNYGDVALQPRPASQGQAAPYSARGMRTSDPSTTGRKRTNSS